jgi:type VI secretion system protein ImpL
MPKPASDMAKEIVEDINGIMKGAVQRDLNSAWASEVLPICRDVVSSRYPIDATSPQDIAIGDFIRLFAPGGALDNFFATYLQQHVDMSKQPWRLRPTGPTGIRLSREALIQLERAAMIRDSFFPGGARSPAVQFEMTPVELDQRATQVRLSIGSQSLSYNHGPQRPVTFRWPDPQGNSETRISFNGPSGPEGEQALGPWSLFKLFDRSTKQVQSPDRMTVTFMSKSLSASFDLRASSVLNPFTNRAMREFRCPEAL